MQKFQPIEIVFYNRFTLKLFYTYVQFSAVMAQNIAWATDANVLASMLDATLSVWLCPNCVHYSDRKVIRKTRVDKDSR